MTDETTVVGAEGPSNDAVCGAYFPSSKLRLRCAEDKGHADPPNSTPHRAWADMRGEAFMQWPEGYLGMSSAEVERRIREGVETPIPPNRKDEQR